MVESAVDAEAPVSRKTIAVLFDYLQGDYQLRLRAAFEDAARERDANLLTFVGGPLDAPTAISAAQNEVYERLVGAPVDGIILAAASVGTYCGADGLLEFCRRFSGIPLCSVSMELPGIPSLVVDNRHGTRVLVDHLIERHRCHRIAYIRGPESSVEANQRYDAYRESLQAHGLESDPALVDAGDFWVDHGAAAMHRLIDRGARFDAVVAANDHMATGALDVLRARNVRVPRDVLVAGFDDAPASLVASPSLTTARQPLTELGRAAVDTLLTMLEGNAVPPLRRVDVQLVPRQSCGCAYNVFDDAASARSKPDPDAPSIDLGELRGILSDSLTAPTDRLGNWDERLSQALKDEIDGRAGAFLMELEDVLEQAQPQSALIDGFGRVVAAMRGYTAHRLTRPDVAVELEALWHAAIALVGAAAARCHARERFQLERAHDALHQAVERISTALSHAELSAALADVFPGLAVHHAAICLYDAADRTKLTPMFVLASESEHVPLDPFDASRLAPEGFLNPVARWSYIVMPIAFGVEQLGLALFQAGQHVSIYSMLRELVGAAVKSASIHRAMIREVAARERAERDELQKEAAIARRIQTAIVPVINRVDGLELAGSMLPAAEVGGDYYDVLTSGDGCWLAIGDVAGHGLLAGLVMLMMQSMVSAMAHSGAPLTPSAMFNGLNSALWDNVRQRLQQDHHATLALIRYQRDGTLTFAGCHEDLLIWRARSGSCERVPTGGVWAGVVRDTEALTRDSQVRLETGDLLVLYTDGVVEALNSHREQLGQDRLCRLIERSATQSVDQVCKTITDAAIGWASTQADDISVLVARYSAQ